MLSRDFVADVPRSVATVSSPQGARLALLAIANLGAVGCAAQAAAPREPVSVFFESPLNLIVLETRIGDEGPFRFVLDSGSTGTVIDADLARRIGLKTGLSGTRRSTAANSQVTTAPVNGGVDFTLAPGLSVHVGRVIAAPFTAAGKMMIGEHFDGMFGSAIFERYVVQVDYAQRSVTFHEPSTYRYAGNGAELAVHFRLEASRVPFIHATLANGDNRLADFPISIDSGGQTMGTISLGRRSDWDGLITPANRVVDAMGVTGLSNEPEGTTHDAFATQMDHVLIGPYEFEDPLVSFSAGGAGFSSLGASLLHRFTVVFDYSRKRLILEPNSRFGQPPMIDRSGALLAMPGASEGNLQVIFVAAGTPAHEAGLTGGDLILAIDGVRAQEIGLNAARALFARAGTYRLQVQRDGRTLETVIVTRSLYDG